LDFVLGPIIAMHGVSTDTDESVAGIQGEYDRDHDKKFHASDLISEQGF
jgi:hypothetical protein